MEGVLRHKCILTFVICIFLVLSASGGQIPKAASQPILPVHNTDTPALPVHNNDTRLSYATIQEAIDAPDTLDGHVIQVDSGLYLENLVVNKALTLIGQNKSDTIVEGNYSDNVITVLSNNVSIMGFTVRHSAIDVPLQKPFVDGICARALFANIKNNTIINNDIGIELLYSSFDTIEGNNLSANSLMGISLYGSYYYVSAPSYCDNNTITENTISLSSTGLFLEGSTNNVVKHNVFSMNGGGGIECANGFNNSLIENEVTRAFEGINILRSNKTLLLGNYIHENKGCGVLMYGSGENEIQQNTVTQNNGGMMLFHSSDYNTIDSNNISVNNGYGIVINSSSSNTVENNTFLSNSGYGVNLYHSRSNIFNDNNVSLNGNDGFYSSDSSSDLYSNNHISLNNASGIAFDYSNNNAISSNFFSENGDNEINFYGSNNNLISNNTINAKKAPANGGTALLLQYISNENTITGNTITGASFAISVVEKSDGNTISANTISLNGYCAISLDDADNNLIASNNFSKTGRYGVIMRGKGNVISNNDISESDYGLGLWAPANARGNLCLNNRISFCDTGAWVGGTDGVFSGNNVSDCAQGLWLDTADNFTLFENTFWRIGSLISDSSANSNCVLFHNNFINSSLINLPSFQKWDNGAEGNYWSIQVGEDKDGNGIWDAPFGPDNYPLVEPWSQHRMSEINWAERAFEVRTDSNFTVSHPHFDQTAKSIVFKITGPPSVEGSCNVTIPKELLDAPQGQWVVTVNDEPIAFDATNNMTHTMFFINTQVFNYIVTTKTVKIVGTDPIDEIPPIARAGSDVTVYASATITFNGSTSTDNIAIKNYTWTFFDREPETFVGASQDYTFMQPGNYLVMLNVTDLRDNWNTSTITVHVLGPHANADDAVTIEAGVP